MIDLLRRLVKTTAASNDYVTHPRPGLYVVVESGAPTTAEPYVSKPWPYADAERIFTGVIKACTPGVLGPHEPLRIRLLSLNEWTRLCREAAQAEYRTELTGARA